MKAKDEPKKAEPVRKSTAKSETPVRKSTAKSETPARKSTAKSEAPARKSTAKEEKEAEAERECPFKANLHHECDEDCLQPMSEEEIEREKAYQAKMEAAAQRRKDREAAKVSSVLYCAISPTTTLCNPRRS
jgi:hypothetical protein